MEKEDCTSSGTGTTYIGGEGCHGVVWSALVHGTGAEGLSVLRSPNERSIRVQMARMPPQCCVQMMIHGPPQCCLQMMIH
jgi:hypothetical protein